MSNKELQLRKVEAYARERLRFHDLFVNVTMAVNHGHEYQARMQIINYVLMVAQEYSNQFDKECFNFFVITKLVKSLTNSLIGDKK